MLVSENQKRIYNLHLASYKKRQNKPCTYRQNFDDMFTNDPNTYIQLQKLDHLFTNNKTVNIKLFFDAPYQLYKDKDYYNLNYYASQAAIKTYNVFLKQIAEQSPDTPSQLEFIKDSLNFIKDFCCKHKINVIDYLTYREFLPLSWAVHIAEYKTSFYVILGFNYFNVAVYDKMFDMPEDEKEMLLGDISKNYAIYKDKLDQSRLARKLVFEGIKIIDKSVKENLKTKIDSDTIIKIDSNTTK